MFTSKSTYHHIYFLLKCKIVNSIIQFFSRIKTLILPKQQKPEPPTKKNHPTSSPYEKEKKREAENFASALPLDGVHNSRRTDLALIRPPPPQLAHIPIYYALVSERAQASVQSLFLSPSSPPLKGFTMRHHRVARCPGVSSLFLSPSTAQRI